MDFLNNLQRKYIPSIHKFRYDQRKARVNSLKQTCLTHPQTLSYQQVKVILRVLKHYKLLPITEQYENQEKRFMFKAGENFLYAAVAGCVPFAVREFYGKGFFKKFALVTGIFVGTYGLLMRGPFLELDRYNRKVAQENIASFSVDLEEEELQPTKQQQQGSLSKVEKK